MCALLPQDFDSVRTADSPLASAERSGDAPGSLRSSHRRKQQQQQQQQSSLRGSGVAAASHAALQAPELGVEDLSAIPGFFEVDCSSSQLEAQAAAAAAAKALAARPGLAQGLVAAAQCPLTRNPMVHPALLAVDGFTYERAAIEAWLDARHASPATGAPASRADLHSPRRVVAEARRDQALDARAQVRNALAGCCCCWAKL
jgi:hypothetical protein